MEHDMMKRLATKDLAEMLGVEAVTVRKYAVALEKAGYAFERSAGDHRLYSSKDAMVMSQLKALRERSGLSVEMAANVVVSKHGEASEIVAVSQNAPDAAVWERYEKLYAGLEEKIAVLTELMQQQALAAVAALPDPRQQRMDFFQLTQAERRVRRRLERQASDAWFARPDVQRFTKRWFWKEENIAARDLFVRDYVEERLDAELQKELGLEEE